MTNKADNKKAPNTEPEITENKKTRKKCFIIMPIADHPDYDSGHFDRVYEHLIKPACELANYEPVRADDSKASHMIMFDILKKIMDCDMAICDISSKNANVFYELGLRQAFNKKTILITDGLQKPPFDIVGFRYVPYTPNLRVDAVKFEILEIAKSLVETENAPEDDVNSIVKLLQIKPATINTVNLNENESLLFDMFNKLQDQIEKLQPTSSPKAIADELRGRQLFMANKNTHESTRLTLGQARKMFSPEQLSKYSFEYYGKDIGKFIGIENDEEYWFSLNGKKTCIPVKLDPDSKILALMDNR